MTVGKKIRKIRESQGLSITELGNRAGLSLSYLSAVETEKSSISLKSLHKVAGALNVSVSYLTDEESNTMIKQEKKNNEYADDLIRFFMAPESMPYIALAKKAVDKGMSLDSLSKLIDIYATR